jgi:uncharacterized protein YqjF (DUF2071 family)
MAQTWHDLLFAHWSIDPAVLRPLVPPQLPLDLFQGRCWIGVVPFWMSHIHARGLPPIPGLSRFPELNVRTYVTLADKPGVYFMSLDAASLPAVWAARTFYHLPYFHAKMSSRIENDWIVYSSRRYSDSAEFHGRYRPTNSAQPRAQGSLEHWLTSRYCLYTVTHDGVYRAEIHHQPWQLQDADASFEINTVSAVDGIPPLAGTPLLHFSKRLEVLIWPLRRVSEAEPVAATTDLRDAVVSPTLP